MKTVCNTSRIKKKKHFLAIKFIFPAISRVISATQFRRLNVVLSIIAITLSALVPAIINTIVTFLPLTALFIKIVRVHH